MRAPPVRPIVIAAGGTGGHFFPAEALGAELVARGHRIALMTDTRSAARKSEVFADRERYVLRGAGIAGRDVLRAAQAATELAAGVVQARKILASIKAAAVVGFGGYPSVAPALGARLLREGPTVILHEQNAVLGRANRLLAGRVAALALSFETTERIPETAQTVLTGNPVRPAVVHRPYEPGAARLLVLGGSLGAHVFSAVVPSAVRELPPTLRSRLEIAQQCRPEDIEAVRVAYETVGVDAELATFFPDIAERLARASLVIARAGASTVAELAMAGRPAILVPLPGAIDDHQSANAHALAAAGAAWVIEQSGLEARALGTRIAALLESPDELARAAVAARGMARPEAATRLAELVEALMRQETRA